jgi:hypothetical protein
MPKWSAVQSAVHKIDEEIADLQRVRERLIAAMNPEPERKRKPKGSKPQAVVKDDKAS